MVLMRCRRLVVSWECDEAMAFEAHGALLASEK